MKSADQLVSRLGGATKKSEALFVLVLSAAVLVIVTRRAEYDYEYAHEHDPLAGGGAKWFNELLRQDTTRDGECG